MENDTRKLLKYIAAELNSNKQYEETGTWHCDCPCQECKDLQAWLDLPWWRRLLAKLNL
jgi:hypothetical protein